jgi:hypothetical protein
MHIVCVWCPSPMPVNTKCILYRYVEYHNVCPLVGIGTHSAKIIFVWIFTSLDIISKNTSTRNCLFKRTVSLYSLVNVHLAYSFLHTHVANGTFIVYGS